MVDNITNLMRMFSKTAESQEHTRKIISRLNRLSTQDSVVQEDEDIIPEI